MFDDFDNLEYQEYTSRSPMLKWIAIIFTYLIALPSIVIGAIQFWVLFAWGRLRPTIISGIVFLELLILIPFLSATHPLKNILSVFSFNSEFNFSKFLFAYISICLFFGIIGSYILILLKARQFKNKPHLLFMNGWMYKFTYRRTPIEILKKKFLLRELQEGNLYNEKESPLGLLEGKPLFSEREIDVNKRLLERDPVQVISRSYEQAKRHTLITGETGSGKSVSILSLIYNDIQNGYPVCVIDFKKSDDILYSLSKWAKDFGRDFYYFANGEPDNEINPFYGEQATYDPFSAGEQSSRADVILSLREWDTASNLYKGRTESLLQALFFALLNVPHDEAPNIPWNEGGLKQIIAAFDKENMFQLIQSLMKQEEADTLKRTDRERLKTLKEIYSQLTSNTQEGKGLRDQLDELKLLCNKLIMSSYGHWFTRGNSSKHINLLELALDDSGPIVLFGLSEMEEKEFASAIGSIITSDLKRAASMKNTMNNKNLYGVYIDEFQTADPRDVTALLEKSRSAEFFITLASQSLEQIAVASKENGENTLQSILDTCGNFLIHNGAKEKSAERISSILGKTKHIVRRAQMKTSSRIFSLIPTKEGMSSTSEDYDWVLPPSELLNLSSPTSENGYCAEAYYITQVNTKKQSLKTARRMQVIAQNEIVHGVSPEFQSFITKKGEMLHKRQTGHSLFSDDNYDNQPNAKEDWESIKTTEENLISQENIDDNDLFDDWELEEISFEETSVLHETIQKEPNNKIKPEKNAIKKIENKPKKMTSFEKMKMQEKEKKKTKNKEIIEEIKKKDETKADNKKTSFKLPDL